MPQCRVCHKELTILAKPCPRCGFQEPAFFGDPSKAEQIINHKADTYRAQFLSEFDFGVTIYHWKDKDGTLVLDRTERLPFGSGTDLLEKTFWHEQHFARIPDLESMDLELSIQRRGQKYHQLPVSLPVPKGKHLQQVGISLSRDMQVQLLLKNPQEQTRSASTPFLHD